MKTTKYLGVQERENKDGSISYTVNYYELGKKKTKMVGNSKDGMTGKKSEKIRNQLIQKSKLLEEQYKNEFSSKTEYEVSLMTFNECYEKYYVPSKKHLKSFDFTNRLYKNTLKDLIGDELIKDLSEQTKRKVINYYTNKVKSVTIEHYLSTGKSLINVLKENNLYKGRNPFKFKRGNKNKELPSQESYRRLGYLTISDINKVKNRLEQDDCKNILEYILFFDISVSTGSRVSTILNIMTDDVTIKSINGTVTLKESKTTTLVKGHLSEYSTKVILKMKTEVEKNTKVFSISYRTLQSYFKKVFDELFNSKLDKNDSLYDYKKISIHSIRHSFGTLLVQQKVDIKTVSLLMGHKRLETTSKYLSGDERTQKESIYNLLNSIDSENTMYDFGNTPLKNEKN